MESLFSQPTILNFQNSQEKTTTEGLIVRNLRQDRNSFTMSSSSVVRGNEESINIFSHPVYVAEPYNGKYYVMRAEYIKVEKKLQQKRLCTSADFIRVEDKDGNIIADLSNPVDFVKQFKHPFDKFPNVSNFNQCALQVRNSKESSKILQRIKIMIQPNGTERYSWIALKAVLDENNWTLLPEYDANICKASDHQIMKLLKLIPKMKMSH